MASIIELRVDLETLSPFNTFFIKGDKDLFIEKIINYDYEQITYLATLRKSDFSGEIGNRKRISSDLRRKYGIMNFEILSESSSLKTYRALIIQKLPDAASSLLRKFYSRIFLVPPLTLSKSGSRINLLVMEGNLRGVRQFLNMLKIPYKILRMKEMLLEGDRLSQKEEVIFRYAYESGFFDIPRRKKSDDICSGLGVSKSTFSRVIRGIEKREAENLINAI